MTRTRSPILPIAILGSYGNLGKSLFQVVLVHRGLHVVASFETYPDAVQARKVLVQNSQLFATTPSVAELADFLQGAGFTLPLHRTS